VLTANLHPELGARHAQRQAYARRPRSEAGGLVQVATALPPHTPAPPATPAPQPQPGSCVFFGHRPALKGGRGLWLSTWGLFIALIFFRLAITKICRLVYTI
jgi:hypothetical protein